MAVVKHFKFIVFIQCCLVVIMSDWNFSVASYRHENMPTDVQKETKQYFQDVGLMDEDITAASANVFMRSLQLAEVALNHYSFPGLRKSMMWKAVQNKLQKQSRIRKFAANFTTTDFKPAVCNLVIAGNNGEKSYYVFCSLYDTLLIDMAHFMNHFHHRIDHGFFNQTNLREIYVPDEASRKYKATNRLRVSNRSPMTVHVDLFENVECDGPELKKSLCKQFVRSTFAS